MIIGWNGETTPAVPLDREIEVAAEAGYTAIELFVPKLVPFLEKYGEDELRCRLQENKLSPLTMNGIENVNLRPPKEFTRVKEECYWLSDISKKIGCSIIVVVPSPRPEGMSWEQVKEETVFALQELADVAAIFDTKLAFEFLAPVNCSVRTLAQGWEIVQATERKHVGLVFDTYHFHVGGSSWESLEQFDIERLYVVHINDAEDLPLDQLTDGHRLLPGEGIFPLSRMVSRLHGRGYGGAYSLEVMRPAYRERDPLEYATAGFDATRRVLEQVIGSG
jgi:2-keto-myo-inositol isomerase